MKKLFTNDQFFRAMTVLGFVGSVICAIYYCIPNFSDFDPSAAFFFAFEAVCIISLFVSYRKHSKNIMKGIIVALLTAMLLDSTCWLNAEFGPDSVFSYVIIAMNGILIINHFIINRDHRSKPMNICINQFLVLIIGAVNIIWSVIWVLHYPYGSDIFGAIAECAYCIGGSATIVCVESRLDAYRLDREAAGWTEGKGYPEGYVHGGEKK